MKILIATGIYPPDIGGPATYSKLLFEELPQHEIDVVVANFGDVKHLPKIIRHMAYFFKVLVNGMKVDVVFAQDPVSTGFPALVATKILRKKFILKIVGDYAWEQGTVRFGIKESLDNFSKTNSGYPFFVRIFKYIERVVAQGADSVIVPSNYLKTIVSNWGIPKEKIQVIYNAFEVPSQVADKDVLRKLMQLDGKVLISVGRLVPWKGFKTLIEIMPELLVKFSNLKLFIVGDGPDKKELEDYIRKYNLGESVRLIGSLDHETLMRYLKASDVFVLNTSYEGFSHQLLECMALEIPIVTTDVGGNKELITNKKNGLFVKLNDKKALTNSISLLLKDVKLTDQITSNGKIKVKQFDKKVMINNLIKTLENI